MTTFTDAEGREFALVDGVMYPVADAAANVMAPAAAVVATEFLGSVTHLAAPDPIDARWKLQRVAIIGEGTATQNPLTAETTVDRLNANGASVVYKAEFGNGATSGDRIHGLIYVPVADAIEGYGVTLAGKGRRLAVVDAAAIGANVKPRVYNAPKGK